MSARQKKSMEKENSRSKSADNSCPEQESPGTSAAVTLTHDQFGEILRHRLATLKGTKFFDQGLTVCNCAREQLSPGCLACKSGTWICIYPGFSCNATCCFCPRPTAQNIEKRMSEEHMNFLFDLLDRRADRIRGLSISGGELFLDNLPAAKKILRHVRTHYPHIYLWGYTNGIRATRDKMKELRDIGMDEIRFNLAATNFHEDIVRKIREDAVRIFPWVTVEVPAYEQTRQYMIQGDGLKKLSDMGVKQLNLAEIRVPLPPAGSNDLSPATRTFLGRRSLYQYRNSLGSFYLNLAESRLATWDMIDHAHELGITLRINDCSQDAKTLQQIQRYMTGLYMIQLYATGQTEDFIISRKQDRLSQWSNRAVKGLSAMIPRLGAAAVLAIGDAYLLPFTRIGRLLQRIRKSPAFMPKPLAVPRTDTSRDLSVDKHTI